MCVQGIFLQALFFYCRDKWGRMVPKQKFKKNICWFESAKEFKIDDCEEDEKYFIQFLWHSIA